jgi:hypothetical protein
MTTLCTAAGQNLTTIGGLHPLAEAVNRLAATSVWLKCALHLKDFLRFCQCFVTTPRGTIPAAGERDGKAMKKTGKVEKSSEK